MDGAFIYISASSYLNNNKKENNDYHWFDCIASQLVRDRIIKRKKRGNLLFYCYFRLYKGIDTTQKKRSRRKRGLDIFRLSRRRSLSCALERKYNVRGAVRENRVIIRRALHIRERNLQTSLSICI